MYNKYRKKGFLDTKEIVWSLWEVRSDVLPKKTSWKKVFKNDLFNEKSIKEEELKEQDEIKEKVLQTIIISEYIDTNELNKQNSNKDLIPQSALFKQLTVKPFNSTLILQELHANASSNPPKNEETKPHEEVEIQQQFENLEVESKY